MQINMKFVMTKERAQAVLGRQMVPDSMGEYIAIALLLMHERLQGEACFWRPYIDLLPTTEEVGCSFTWADEELDFLDGSAAVDAARSLQNKVRAESARVAATSGPNERTRHTPMSHPNPNPHPNFSDCWRYSG